MRWRPVPEHRPSPASVVPAQGTTVPGPSARAGKPHRRDGRGADVERRGEPEDPARHDGGRKLRLEKGLPKPSGGEGDLYAIVQIVNPTVLSDRERELFKELADKSTFNPRGHFAGEKTHGD